MNKKVDDIRISAQKELISPDKLMSSYVISDQAAKCVCTARNTISRILHNQDPRILVVVGPCSVHDVDATLEYATRLKETCIDNLSKWLHIVMRVYFEKPRTTVGWKGIINDPYMDNSFEINKGLEMARSLLLELNAKGVPAATEYLDLISPQYIADLISWGAIGARTTESQSHRELASGISCPIGFKNGTDGNIQIAVDAIQSASHPHHFLSVTKQGKSAIFSTVGNSDCHVILRGGKGKPNYLQEYVHSISTSLRAKNLNDKIMIDCSHANSSKQFKKQLEACADISAQLERGARNIMGVMIESNLVEGRQDIKPGQQLIYGQSVTDACVGWEDTLIMLEQLAQAVQVQEKQKPPPS